MGSETPIRVGEMHALTLAEHISMYMLENGLVINPTAGTHSLACAAIKIWLLVM